MGIKITSVSEALDNNGLKFLVHGMAGVGKTVLCATTGAPTLIISAESGLLSIAGAPDHIKTTVVKTIGQLEDAYDFLEENIDMFDWVCLDSISEIAEVLLADEKKNSKDPRQAYGNLSDRMLSIMRSFRDLPNMNVIFTCKQQRQVDDDTNVTRFVPLLPGKSLTNSISYLFDEVFAMRVEKDDEGEDYHILQTGRDRNYEAKDRSGVLDMFEDPSIKRIAAKIKAGLPEEEEVKKVEKESAGNREESPTDKVLDEDTYWYHAESESAVVIKAGEPLEGTPEHCSEMSKEEYLKFIESQKEVSSEKIQQTEEQAKENTSHLIKAVKETVYLYHNTSDAVMKLEAGQDIEDDGNIDVIDYKTYIQHKKRIKKENA